MRRGRILIFLGVIIGLGTAIAALLFLQPAPLEKVEVTQEVVVAVQPVGEGETIVPEAVELREMEEKQIPPGAMFTTYEVEGKIATTDILQGQVIQDAMITDEEAILREGENASILIPKGKVAVAFPIDVISSVSYAIQPGDFIDVLITMKFIDLDEASQTRLPLRLVGEPPENCPYCVAEREQLPRVATQLIVQDVEVLKVGLWGAPVTPPPAEGEEEAVGEEQPAPARPEYLTLLVSQQDALVLKYTHESGARLDLALRSSGDHDLMTTEPVTLDYMLARFGIAVPPKRPYTLQSFEEIELGGLE